MSEQLEPIDISPAAYQQFAQLVGEREKLADKIFRQLERVQREIIFLQDEAEIVPETGLDAILEKIDELQDEEKRLRAKATTLANANKKIPTNIREAALDAREEISSQLSTLRKRFTKLTLRLGTKKRAYLEIVVEMSKLLGLERELRARINTINPYVEKTTRQQWIPGVDTDIDLRAKRGVIFFDNAAVTNVFQTGKLQ